jgi:hypothetical protein
LGKPGLKFICFLHLPAEAAKPNIALTVFGDLQFAVGAAAVACAIRTIFLLSEAR